MKKSVNIFEYAGHICSSMKKGILLTTAVGDKVNTMTIGWGKIGIEWNRPVFIAYVRESRYTKSMLEENGEFTVNIPYGELDSEVLRYCGTKSGRDCNKIHNMKLTLEPSNTVSVPGIKEFPLTIECKVIYSQKQNLNAVPADILNRFYPEEPSGFRDYHIAYYGEITDAYIIEN